MNGFRCCWAQQKGLLVSGSQWGLLRWFLSYRRPAFWIQQHPAKLSGFLYSAAHLMPLAPLNKSHTKLIIFDDTKRLDYITIRLPSIRLSFVYFSCNQKMELIFKPLPLTYVILISSPSKLQGEEWKQLLSQDSLWQYNVLLVTLWLTHIKELGRNSLTRRNEKSC